MRRALVLCLLLALDSSARASLLLNEILYDPEGSDGGHEFVELYCAGPDAFDLDGVRLVFVNGADPTHPKTLWIAPPGLRLEAGGFLVLGEAEVPERDIELVLGLQNGPDALWLMQQEQPIDRVAWGEIEGLGEGAPAPDPSSTSLGRVPDGVDHDDNQRDWRALPQPSPGAPNARPQRVDLLEITAEPAWRAEAGPAHFEVLLVAAGYAEQQAGRLDWWLDGAAVHREDFALALGESLRIGFDGVLGPGPHALRAQSFVDGMSQSLEAGYRVGVGSLRLNEIMARPLSGEPEWIELYYLGASEDTLEAWSLTDASLDWKALPPLRFSATGYLILTADSLALRASYSLPLDLPVLQIRGGWPTLNNSNVGGEDFADRILLRDAEQVVVDQLVYSEEELSEAGRSLERGRVVPGRAREWFPSPASPTPGAQNLSAAYAPPEDGLLVRPDPFTPDGDGVGDLLHVQLKFARFDGRVQAEVRDLAGERVIELGVGSADADLQQWIWDGRDQAGRPVPMGAYLVVVTAGGSGVAPRSWRALVALGRRS